MPDGPAPLPGGVGVSRLRVYDTVAPDGLVGGTPHVHLCCTEGYVVTDGEGAVQTLTSSGFRETALRPGVVVWFEPGTVHRLVNTGRLGIVVLMQNSGLPEAGDAVLTFPPDVLADPGAYAAAVALPDGGAPGADVRAAYRRRDLAVTGFQALRSGGPAALAAFHAAAVALRQPLLAGWGQRWEAGAGRAAASTGSQLDALERGDPRHLAEAGVYAVDEPVERGRLGMCGLLDTYPAAV
ncbi:cupin domain-containing protein [Micromonospora sp. C81]|uniref:cupin domain-containing protein n=1 Tax=Micromonospora sp. C81 TaxID=2824881 RepID=UPI001B35E29A|nr:cupin domain-containing protein [Micromonospora sp. C81]MBQ1034874.1 cupin domain-containing protein [Micromonospora sp. C81]